MHLGHNLSLVGAPDAYGAFQGDLLDEGVPAAAVHFVRGDWGVSILHINPVEGAASDVVMRCTQALLCDDPALIVHTQIHDLATLRWYQRHGPQGMAASGLTNGEVVIDHPLALLELEEGVHALTLQRAGRQPSHHLQTLEQARDLWNSSGWQQRCLVLRSATVDQRVPRELIWPLYLAALQDVQPDVRRYASKEIARAEEWHPTVDQLLNALQSPLQDLLGVPCPGEVHHARRNVRLAVVFAISQMVSMRDGHANLPWAQQVIGSLSARLGRQARTWTASHDRQAWSDACRELIGGPFATGFEHGPAAFRILRIYLHRHRVIEAMGVKDDRCSWMLPMVVAIAGETEPTTRDALLANAPDGQLPQPRELEKSRFATLPG